MQQILLMTEPFLVAVIVVYISGQEDMAPPYLIYIYVSLLPLTVVISSLLDNFGCQLCRFVAAKMKSACCVLIYEKVY